MRVTRRSDSAYTERVFHYRGTLEENIIACKKEIAKIREQLPLYQAIYDKAKRELESKHRRLDECQTFIHEAENHSPREKQIQHCYS